MVDNKIPIKERDSISRPTLGGDFRYGKLILLRDCIKDVETDMCQLRNIINTVCNEVYVANEKIRALLESNQKRIDLLKDLESKIGVAEYKRTSYIEEFIDLIPFNLIRDYYNGFLNITETNNK